MEAVKHVTEKFLIRSHGDEEGRVSRKVRSIKRLCKRKDMEDVTLCAKTALKM